MLPLRIVLEILPRFIPYILSRFLSHSSPFIPDPESRDESRSHTAMLWKIRINIFVFALQPTAIGELRQKKHEKEIHKARSGVIRLKSYHQRRRLRPSSFVCFTNVTDSAATSAQTIWTRASVFSCAFFIQTFPNRPHFWLRSVCSKSFHSFFMRYSLFRLSNLTASAKGHLTDRFAKSQLGQAAIQNVAHFCQHTFRAVKPGAKPSHEWFGHLPLRQ